MFLPRLVGPGAIVLALFSMGCAANKAASPACQPIPEEFAQFGIVYRDCAVDKKVIPPTPPRLNYQPTQGCGRVELLFVVDTTGKPIPESAKVVRSNDPGLTQAVLASLHAMRYTPARKGGQPVQQLASLLQGYVVQVSVVPANAPRVRQRPPRGGPQC